MLIIQLILFFIFFYNFIVTTMRNVRFNFEMSITNHPIISSITLILLLLFIFTTSDIIVSLLLLLLSFVVVVVNITIVIEPS